MLEMELVRCCWLQVAPLSRRPEAGVAGDIDGAGSAGRDDDARDLTADLRGGGDAGPCDAGIERAEEAVACGAGGVFTSAGVDGAGVIGIDGDIAVVERGELVSDG